MLRSLPETLLNYTSEGVIIRARYIRQLDNFNKLEIMAKQKAKKLIQETQLHLAKQRKEFIKQAYGEGLKALLTDILRFCAQYQENFSHFEMKQRDKITETLSQFFQSPEIQLELTQQLISRAPSTQKLIVDIPLTLKPYLERVLDNKNIEFNTHENRVIAMKTDDQITFFDPTLLIKDLQSLFHQPFSEKYQPEFTQHIKETLVAYIDKFDPLDELEPDNGDQHEN